MTNVTSTGAEAGVNEVSHSENSEISRKTGVEPIFSEDPPSSSVRQEDTGGTPSENLRFESATDPVAEPTSSDITEIPAKGPTFASLGLSPDLLKAVEQSGYTIPTPIQAQSIPHV